jgi:hypothetical protein
MKTFISITFALALAHHCVAEPESKPTEVSPPADAPVSKEAYPYVIKVRDFFGAEGYGYDYFLAKDSLKVVLWDDYGSPNKEVLSKSLTKDEQKAWADYLTAFPLKTLKESYINEMVLDGMQRTFSFKTTDPEKVIRVSNMRVKEFDDLCNRLNQLLPEKLKIQGGGASVTPKSTDK